MPDASSTVRCGGVDPIGVVDDEPDAVTEQGSVVDGGGAAAGDHLMQPDSLDENRTRIHHGDVEIGAQPQMVGGQRAGVSAADHDDVSALGGHVVSCPRGFAALKTPPRPRL